MCACGSACGVNTTVAFRVTAEGTHRAAPLTERPAGAAHSRVPPWGLRPSPGAGGGGTRGRQEEHAPSWNRILSVCVCVRTRVWACARCACESAK